MQWNELKSDIKLGNLVVALHKLDCSSAIHLVTNLMRGTRIYALRCCVETVMAHVDGDTKEVGGLLLGQVWEDNLNPKSGDGPLVILVDAVPSAIYSNTAVSLKMGTEIWGRINERVPDDLIVVGWYHSHPNLGAFFSGTDRGTQRAFFNHSYSVGWVIDPFRDERKLFVGRDSEEYRPSLLVLNHGLEMAKSH
jgi:proteasome lid subunit RPN8/RPN11